MAKTETRFTIHKKDCSWKDSLGRVEPGEHGTSAQYGRALRVGATPCAACRAANTAKDMAWRRANPGKKSGVGVKAAKVADLVDRKREKAAATMPAPAPRQAELRGRKVS